MILVKQFPGLKGMIVGLFKSPPLSSSRIVVLSKDLIFQGQYNHKTRYTMAHAVWTKLLADVDTSCIQRSSQTLSVIAGNAYIYGGELRPREPVDSAVYRMAVSGGMYVYHSTAM